MKYDVLKIDGSKAGSVELSDAIFGVEAKGPVLARVVKYQLAKRRAGTHSTKVISEVSGTTKKPFAQKGTGRARQGSLRSPQMRGGATLFGPLPQDFTHKLPKKIRALGLKMALSAKALEKKLVIIDSEAIAAPKTSELKAKIAKLGLVKPLFIGGAEIDKNFALAIREVYYADVLPTIGANVYDILKHDSLVITSAGVDGLLKRLGE